MKKKPELGFATCGTCMGSINLTELLAAQAAGKRYVHGCGRVLVKGDESEVPTGGSNRITSDESVPGAGR